MIKKKFLAFSVLFVAFFFLAIIVREAGSASTASNISPFFGKKSNNPDLNAMNINISVEDKRDSFTNFASSDMAKNKYLDLDGQKGLSYFEDYIIKSIGFCNGRISDFPSAVPMKIVLEVFDTRLKGAVYYKLHALVQFSVISSTINKRYTVDMKDGDKDAPLGKYAVVSNMGAASEKMICAAMFKGFKELFNDINKSYTPVIVSSPVIENDDAKTADNDYCIRKAWSAYFNKADLITAKRYISLVLNREPDNYKAHETLYQINRAIGNYEGMIDHLLIMYKQDALENLVYGNQWIYAKGLLNGGYLKLSPEKIKEFKKSIETCLKTNTYKHDEIRRLMIALLGNLYGESGELDKAIAVTKEIDANVDKWMTIGPFENGNQVGFDETYPPESGIDLTHDYPGTYKRVKWQEIKNLELGKKVNLSSLYDRNSWFTAYALSYVFSPDTREVLIDAGCSDACKLWLNDELVITDDHYKEFEKSQYIRRVKLQNGWNKVLLKLCSRGDCVFCVSITDLQGRLLNDIKCGTDPSGYVRPADKLQEKLDFPAGLVAERYQELLANNPSDAMSCYYLAHNANQRGIFHDAVEYAEKLLALDQTSSLFHYEAGAAYFNDELVAKAIREFKKTIELNPGYVPAYSALATCYLSKGMKKEAEDLLCTLAGICPRYTDTYFLSAFSYAAEKQLVEAVKQMDKVLKIYPWNSGAHFRRALYRKYQGLERAAIPEMKEAIEHNQFSRQMRSELIKLYQDQNKIGDALKETDTLLNISKDPDYYLTKIDCYQRQGKTEKALLECKTLSAEYPGNPGIYYALGDIYNKKNDKEKTITNWKMALQHKPNFIWLREYLYKLYPEENKVVNKYGITDEERKQILGQKYHFEKYPKAISVDLSVNCIFDINEDGSYAQTDHFLKRNTQ